MHEPHQGLLQGADLVGGSWRAGQRLGAGEGGRSRRGGMTCRPTASAALRQHRDAAAAVWFKSVAECCGRTGGWAARVCSAGLKGIAVAALCDDIQRRLRQRPDDGVAGQGLRIGRGGDALLGAGADAWMQQAKAKSEGIFK